MLTEFLLMAQYGPMPVIPIELVCRDYFRHLSVNEFSRKVTAGDIALPIVRIEVGSAKAARGVALMDLAHWIDQRIEAARKETWQLTGVDYASTPKLRAIDAQPTPGQTERSARIWARKRAAQDGDEEQ